MQKMSTGQDSTLGNYKTMASLFFGKDSEAVLFLDEKIHGAPRGADEEVIADERQMVHLLMNIDQGGSYGEGEGITS
jgi:hypothetical protein